MRDLLGAARGFIGSRSAPAEWDSSRRYAVALVMSAMALAISLIVDPLDADNSVASLLFLAAVGLSGWYAGLQPALVATAFGAVALDYFFETPRYELAVTSARTVTDLLSFLLVSILLGSLNARLRQAIRRLRAERDLAKSERDRAEAAVSARDELLTAVSHDLRTPLTGIKTSVYSLRSRAMRLSPQTRERMLLNIEAEADRLIHFVTGALALRRLENGQIPRAEWNGPGEVVSAVLDRCVPALGDRPVTFAVGDDLPLVRLDAALLDQALSQLLENVAVHTPPGSPVCIEGSVREGAFYLAVSDAGPGIPTDARERIFSKYERLDQTAPGLGLGLAIARGAVDAQGGRLSVEDSPLGGARFVIVIPGAAKTSTIE